MTTQTRADGPSEAQVRYLTTVAGKAGVEPEAEAQRRFGRPVAELSKSEVSRLIDSLKPEETETRAVARRETLEPEVIEDSIFSQLAPAQQKIITIQIAPGASGTELEYFLSSARRAHLDPFAIPRQIVCFPQIVDGQTKYQPLIMVDGWRKLLSDTGRVTGIDVEWCGRDGAWRDSWPDDASPLAARVTIYVRGEARPVKFVAHYRDFVQYQKGGFEVRDNWRRMPTHMLAIRALTHCIRQALMVIGSLGEAVDAALGLGYADEDGEIRDEFDDGDSFAVARRRFYATAHNLGLEDKQVYRAMQVSDGKALEDAMRRDADMRKDGGYNRAIAYLEQWAASSRRDVTLPEGLEAGTASELLYQDGGPVQMPNGAAAGHMPSEATEGPGDADRDGGALDPGDGGDDPSPAAVPAPGPEEHLAPDTREAEHAASGNGTSVESSAFGQTDRPPSQRPATVQGESDTGQPLVNTVAAAPGDGGGAGGHTDVASVPAQTEQQTEAAEEAPVACTLCDEPATVLDGPDGFPLCDLHAAEARNAPPDPVREPAGPAVPAMPDWARDYETFCRAAQQDLRRSKVDVARAIGRGLRWDVPRDIFEERWAAVAAQVTMDVAP